MASRPQLSVTGGSSSATRRFAVLRRVLAITACVIPAAIIAVGVYVVMPMHGNEDLIAGWARLHPPGVTQVLISSVIWAIAAAAAATIAAIPRRSDDSVRIFVASITAYGVVALSGALPLGSMSIAITNVVGPEYRTGSGGGWAASLVVYSSILAFGLAVAVWIIGGLRKRRAARRGRAGTRRAA